MRRGGWRREDLGPIAAFLRSSVGLEFPAAQMDRLEDGVRLLAARLGARTPPDFLDLLRARPEALDDLVHELTVGESFFFREPEQLEFIRSEVLPPLLHSGRRIFAWSAGCAGGEEAYTLAILLRGAPQSANLRILGTDVSRPRLEAARAGIYGRWSLRGVTEEEIQRHFRRRGRRFEIAPELREAVEFRHLNLAAEDPVAAGSRQRFDLILCRNVLIYFDPATIARVAQRLLDSLSEKGWLFLGASDPMLSEYVECERVATGAGLAYRRPSAVRGQRRSVTVGASRGGGTGAAPSVRPSRPAVERPRSAPRQTPRRVSPRPEMSVTPAPAAPAAAPSDIDTARRIRALADGGDLPAAGQACAAALDLHRTSPELHYLHALLLTEGGQHAEAEEAVRRALYLDRGLVVAHLLLGLILLRLARIGAARRPLTTAERLLERMEADEPVPGSGGESAAELLDIVRAQLRSLQRQSS